MIATDGRAETYEVDPATVGTEGCVVGVGQWIDVPSQRGGVDTGDDTTEGRSRVGRGAVEDARVGVPADRSRRDTPRQALERHAFRRAACDGHDVDFSRAVEVREEGNVAAIRRQHRLWIDMGIAGQPAGLTALGRSGPDRLFRLEGHHLCRDAGTAQVTGGGVGGGSEERESCRADQEGGK